MTQFLHPSVDSKIVDNSNVFQTADGTTALFQVIQSAKGQDNVLTRVTSDSEFLFKFGKPNLAKYGQAGYNVLEWTKAGGLAYVLRIQPETSTYATTGLYVDLKTVELDNTKLISVHTFNEASVTSIAGMKTLLADTLSFTSNTTDATIPLGIIHPYGRGDGYNDLGVRVTLRDDMDATFEFRTYDITVTSKDAAGNVQDLEGPFMVAFDPEAVDKANQSLYWVNILNKYSQTVSVVDYRSGFDKITDYLMDGSTEEDFNPQGLDIIFGRARETAEAPVYSNITWVTEENKGDTELVYTDEKTFFKPNAVNFIGKGVVGPWTGGDTIDALTINAYSGITDASVRDLQFVEIDVMLDANYSSTVKKAMGDLAVDRDDCVALLDLNFQANEQQTLDHRSESVSYAHRNVSIFAHDMEVFDAFNGENIRVTSTYLLARKIPEIDNANGLQYTFVGPKRGVITGFENINFIPNPIWRESLYKAKINYIERDPRKVNFASQSTSQVQNSALSDINNVRSILRIKRDVTALMADYRMEFNDTITYESANYDLNNYLQKWVGNRACSTISGTIFASDYDRQQKLARVTIELTFTGIIERVAIQIVVNR